MNNVDNKVGNNRILVGKQVLKPQKNSAHLPSRFLKEHLLSYVRAKVGIIFGVKLSIILNRITRLGYTVMIIMFSSASTLNEFKIEERLFLTTLIKEYD